MGSSLSSALGAESVPMKALMPSRGRLKRPHPLRQHAASDTPPTCGGAPQRARRAPGPGGAPHPLGRRALPRTEPLERRPPCIQPGTRACLSTSSPTVRLGFATAASVMSAAMSTSAAERSWGAAIAAPDRSSAFTTAGAVVSGSSLSELDSSVSASSTSAPSAGAAASTASARRSRTRRSRRSEPISAQPRGFGRSRRRGWRQPKGLRSLR